MDPNPFAPPSGPPPARQPWGAPGTVPPDWASWPQTPPEDPAHRRRRRGIWLGMTSLVLVVATVVLGLAGAVLLLALVGAFLLLAAVATFAAGVCLAVASLAVLSRARVEGSSRLLAMAPALTSLALAAFGSAVLYAETHDGPDVPSRPVGASASPVEVVQAMRIAMFGNDWGDACLLLAGTARPAGCEHGVGLCDGDCAPSRVLDVRLDRTTERQALVSYTYVTTSGRHRVRLQRGDEGWELLDVPGVFDRCVDIREDPFGCAVRG